MASNMFGQAVGGRAATQEYATQEYVKDLVSKQTTKLCQRLLGEIGKHKRVPDFRKELASLKNKLDQKEERGGLSKLESEVQRLETISSENRLWANGAHTQLKHLQERITVQRVDDLRGRLSQLEALYHKLSDQAARTGEATAKLQRAASVPAPVPQHPAPVQPKTIDEVALARYKAEWKAEVRRELMDEMNAKLGAEVKKAAFDAVQAHVEYAEFDSEEEEEEEIEEEPPVPKKRKAPEPPPKAPKKAKQSAPQSAADVPKGQSQKKSKQPSANPAKKKTGKQKKNA